MVAYYLCSDCQSPLYRTYVEQQTGRNLIPESIDTDDLDLDRGDDEGDKSETFLRPSVTCECEDKSGGWILPTKSMMNEEYQGALYLCSECESPIYSVGKDGAEHYLSHYECDCETTPEQWFHVIPEDEQGVFDGDDESAVPIQEFPELT